ncbi:MAG: hypothetical protein JOY51_05605 [Nevskia sp.]|nr:hypothetical protein [Nevskia sp.]
MNKGSWVKLAAAALAAAALLQPALAQQQDDSDDVVTDTTLVQVPSQPAARAPDALLLDLARAGSSWVAVGQRGIILLSADGKQWQQVPTPADTTLTRVRFLDASHGWAIGYDGTILNTTDGGKSWKLQQFDAAWGKRWFAVLFFDADNGLLAGANGILKKTADGGKTWDAVNSETFADTPNLYNLVALGDGSLLLAGERGFLARSTDKGANWTQLKSPYTGSYFGALATGKSGVLIYGLRGNAFYAADIARAAPLSAKELEAMHAAASNAENAGAAQNPVSEVAGWVHLKHDDTEPLFGAAVLPEGGIVLVGQNGRVMRADLATASLARVQVNTDINMNAAVADGKSLVTVGTSGVKRLSLP